MAHLIYFGPLEKYPADDNKPTAFVNTGSSVEYGMLKMAAKEDMEDNPQSPYAASKVIQTRLCQEANSRRLNVSTLRLYDVYGPRGRCHELMPTLIKEGLKGKLPPLANSLTAHDFIYIDDVVRAYLSAARLAYSNILNICSGKMYSSMDIVELASKIMHIDAEPVWGMIPSHNHDTPFCLGDNSKAKEDLNWHPQVELEDGMRKMIEYEQAAM